MGEVSTRRRLAYALLPLAAALPVLLLHASHYMPFMSDDSLIVARYAERLIEGHGLTWTDGERVEGYSNLLWVLSIAALGSLGVDLLVAARVLGALGMGAVLVALAHACSPRSLLEALPPSVAGLLLAAAGPIAAWTIGGLEQPLLAALLAWALVAVFPLVDGEVDTRRAWRVGIPLALLCWTRPDGPLFTAVFAAVLVAVSRLGREGWRLGLRTAALPVLAVATQLGFRLAYYGDWLPNPAYMKARLDHKRLAEGLDYVLGAYAWMAPALALAGLGLIACFVTRRHRARAILLLTAFVVWSAYVTAIGGDVFAARRHTIPLWVLLAFSVSLGLDCARQRSTRTLLVATLASLPAIGWMARQQFDDPRMQQAKRQYLYREGEVLARVLGEGFAAERPLVAVTAAGTIPYYSKLPALDMLGLNDRHIARQRPETPGLIGHDHGDGAYVLDREPDLIVFNLGTRANFLTGEQMLDDPRFERDYQFVHFRGYVPHERGGDVYVRTFGRVGIRVEADAVVVPGYLLRGTKLVAQPGVDGGIETLVPAGARLKTRALPLGPGLWRVRVEPPNPHVDAGLRVNWRPKAEVAAVAEGETPVLLYVSSHDVDSVLGEIWIERIADAAAAN